MTDSGNGVVLAVLDGIGVRDETAGNAVAQADTPTLDRLFQGDQYTTLDAAGPAVGLPTGYPGNSEVGHLHLGAGRVVEQDLTRINTAIAAGTLRERDAIRAAIDHAQAHDGTVHLVGIVSDGGVHGHVDHVTALLKVFADAGVDVVTHAVLDGRDAPPETADRFVAQVAEAAAAAGTGRIGSLVGRFYAMDRDRNWERTQAAYRLLTQGAGESVASVDDALAYIWDAVDSEYFAPPVVVADAFRPIDTDDVVLFTNFRNDRMRQLTACFVSPDEPGFDPAPVDAGYLASMTPYREDPLMDTVFPKQRVDQPLASVLSDHDIRQLRVAESQKQPHVTYFFDGQHDGGFPETDEVIVPSADVDAYDELPGMAADAVTDAAVDAVTAGDYGFILVNYANGDLVGHTGDIDATVAAVETVDQCVDRLVEAATAAGYTVIVTADHGNCEKLRDGGALDTGHTLNSVPCRVVGRQFPVRDAGAITHIAATVLSLLELPVPEAMQPSLRDDTAVNGTRSPPH